VEVAPHLFSIGLAGVATGLAGWTAGRANTDGRLVRPGWLVAAVAVLLMSLAGPLDRLGEERSLAVHVTQHMLLFSAVPALFLVAAQPALSAGKEMSLARALALVAGGAVVIWALHAPPVMNATVRSPELNDATHVVLLAAGFALAWPLASPSRLRGMSAVAYLAVAELLIGVLGIWLLWIPDLVYAAYADAVPLFGWSAKTDQSVAGALLLVAEEPILAVEVAILFIAALQDD
jgi:cytochrome c oxidase assembly factor CtaG